MNKNEVIDNLRKLANDLKDKKYLTGKDLRLVKKLHYYTYFHFRNLGNALKVAGLPASPLAVSMSVTDTDLINYLKDIKESTGHSATVWDIQHDDGIYKKYSKNKITWSIYKTRFGGLKKAKELAEKPQSKKEDIIITDMTKDIDSKMIKDIYENNSDIDPEYASNKRRFWGKAAELHVTAELLYRGFQAATIPVDVGLDILAVKKNKPFYFQVKHKDIKRKEPITLTKSSFAKSGAAGVFYVFVPFIS
jgi:hypothetical protein